MSNPNTNSINSLDTTGQENDPGQNQISFRLNSYSGFLQAMQASLSTTAVPGHPNSTTTNRPLQKLASRQLSDPTIALLDAWACAADVLTFYQERIANEAYLRTALQPRSLAEMSRLVGYAPRPGVAASVFLSFTTDKGASLTIPAGAPVQSVPAPQDVSQVPQTFETSQDLFASSDLNTFRPRLTQPLAFNDPSQLDALDGNTITVAGLTNNLHVGDIIFIDGGADNLQRAFRITDIKLLKADAAYDNRTVLTLQKLVFESPAKPPEPKPVRPPSNNILVKFASYPMHAIRSLARIVTFKRRKPPPVVNDGPVPFLQKVPAPTSTTANQNQPTLDSAFRSLDTGSNSAHPPEIDIRNAFVNSDVQQRQSPKEENFAFVKGAPLGAAPADQRNVVPALKPINEPQMQLLEAMLGAEPQQALESIRAASSNTAGSAANVYVFRQQAAPFGKDAPLVATANTGAPVSYSEWHDPDFMNAVGPYPNTLILNKSYPAILPNSWVMIVGPSATKSDPDNATAPVPIFAQVTGVGETAATGLGLTVSATELQLSVAWRAINDQFIGKNVRSTTVWVVSEKLDTTAAPLDDQLQWQHGDQTTLQFDLDDIYRGLEIGKPLILTGELTDVPNSPVSDVFTVTAVNHYVSATPPYTNLTIQRSIASPSPKQSPKSAQNQNQSQANPSDPQNSANRTYSRKTMQLFGNIVSATHGETQREVLGSGDASVAMQTFTLKATPLTYISAPNQTGSQSTLSVYVNDIQWHEATAGLSDAGPNDHLYVVRIDKTDTGTTKTSIIFGDSKQGAAPATGRENIRAVYRTGIGAAGNVPAGRITLLKQRPQGLTGVNNPIDASGGADPETSDSIRINAPIGARALGRVVSVSDYQDFARSFAGVTKAKALKTHDGKFGISVVVAGDDPEPLDRNSDLMKNLNSALKKFGNPSIPVQPVPHKKRIVLLQVSITIYPDFTWTVVQSAISDALFYNFGYAGQDIGEQIYQSDVAQIIQSVPGVQYVTIDVFTSVSGEPTSAEDLAKTVANALKADPQPSIAVGPHEIAYLTPDVEKSLVIQLQNPSPFTAVSGGAS